MLLPQRCDVALACQSNQSADCLSHVRPYTQHIGVLLCALFLLRNPCIQAITYPTTMQDFVYHARHPPIAAAGSLMDDDSGAAAQGSTNLAAAQAVFSVTVEGDVLPDSNGAPASAEPLTDWRLVVAPALVVENLLPVKGTFLVWERPQASILVIGPQHAFPHLLE